MNGGCGLSSLMAESPGQLQPIDQTVNRSEHGPIGQPSISHGGATGRQFADAIQNIAAQVKPDL
jgi:hypothetical protein